MNLKPMSLNQKESKKLSVSKNVVATHLTLGNSSVGPILWLEDDITEIYICILYNKYVLLTR